MADLLIKRLEEELRKQGFNYKSLSLACGLGETTIRDIMIGRARNPRRDTLQKIAKILGKPLLYFLIEDAQTVPVTDTGTRLSLTHSLREPGKNPDSEFIEAPPESGHRDIAAVRLRGNTMSPYLPDGSIVYYNDRRESGFNDWLGKLCVVQVKGGTLGVYVLQKGTLYGRYDLESYNAKPLKDTQIEWCAKVLFIKQA